MPDIAMASRDWLSHPLGVINQLFETRQERGDDNEDFGVEEFFGRILHDSEALAQIPLVNHVPQHELKPFGLVRARCMVQEIGDREMFPARYIAINKETGEKINGHGMFRDSLILADKAELTYDNKDLRERQVAYCIPIPGESAWVTKQFGGKAMTSSPDTTTQSSTSITKRPREPESNDMETDDAAKAEITEQSAPTDADSAGKKVRLDTMESDDAGAASEKVPTVVEPMQEMEGACVLKFYGHRAADIRVTNVVDIIGVLDLSTTTEDVMDDMWHERLPAASVPRIHCLAYVVNPPVLSPLSAQQGTATILSCVPAVRQSLMQILCEAVAGDRVVAEYLLMHILSFIYNRQTQTGKLSINIQGASAEMVTALKAVLMSLLDRCVHLPLTIDSLNKATFAPKQDGETLRLRHGLLQLPQHTQILVDDVSLESGQLNATGIENLQALQHVIAQQALPYKFEYFTSEFEVDNRVLLLSGGKSLLSGAVDIIIRVQPTQPCVPSTATLASLSEKELNDMRAYIIAARDLSSSFTVPESVSQEIEKDYVEMRKRDQQSMNPQTLSRMVTMAKYASVGMGQAQCSSQAWESAKALEAERLARA